MSGRGAIRGLSVVGMAVALMWQPLAAADDAGAQFKLEPPAGRSYRAPDDKYRIHIATSVPVEVLQNLHLEVDGIDQDVGATVTREGEFAVYTPPQRLGYGRHELRLVEVTPQGEIKELALWSFDVRQSASFREAQVQGNVDLNAAWRALDHNQTNPPDRFTAQGGANVQGSVADKDWRVNARASFIYDRLSTVRKLDLGDYLVTRDTDQTNLSVGHHAVEPTSGSLILQGFNRRGLSATARTADQRASVTGFVMRTESITGFQYGLGVTDSQHRTTGITGTIHPLRQSPDKLTLSATHLYGQGIGAGIGDGSAGTGTGSPTPSIPTGDASSIVADSQLMDHKLRLRGEYAYANFDADGSGTLLSKRGDHAYSLLAMYTPTESMVQGQPLRWNVGVQNQSVGTYFHSQGNPGLPNDVKALRVFSDLNWKGFSLNGAVGRQRDNVNHDSTLPTVQIDSVQLAGNYTPMTSGTGEEGWALFRQASYGINYAHARSKQIKTPAGFAGIPVDKLENSLGVTANFTPGQWSWGVGHTVSWSEDYTGTVADTVNHLTDLHASAMIGERLSLGPSVQWNVLTDKGTNVDSKTLSASLSGTYAFIPQKLNSSFNYTLTRLRATDESVHSDTTTVDAGLTWTYLQAHDNRPGVTFFLNGNFQKLNDASGTTTNGNNYQVFVGINIGWPMSYPRTAGY